MSVTTNAPDKSRATTGWLAAVFSGATFGTSGSFADSLLRTGWTPAAVVTLRISIAALLLTVPALISLRGRWNVVRPALPSILAYGLVAVAGCQLFFFNAVSHLDVGIALLLEYSGILLVVAWMWLRHGQRPRRLTSIGGAAALLGLVLVLQPGSGRIDLVGVFWAMCAATGLAVYFVMSERMADTMPPIALAWAAMLVGAVTLIVADLAQVTPFHLSTRSVTLDGRTVSWLVPILGVALISGAVAYVAGIAGTRLLGARLASFAGLSEVLFAVLFAWLLLGQRPGGWQLVGGLIVIGGIALVRAGDTAAVAKPVATLAPAQV